MPDKIEMMSRIRYAERLCERTARLYRRIQAFGTFATVVGGSAVLSALSPAIPQWVSLAGGCAFALFGAAMIAVRPGDRAAANEADVRRYARLRHESTRMDDAVLEAALHKAAESNAPEVESLRNVAYNDVARELGREDVAFRLTWPQRVMAALA